MLHVQTNLSIVSSAPLCWNTTEYTGTLKGLGSQALLYMFNTDPAYPIWIWTRDMEETNAANSEHLEIPLWLQCPFPNPP